MVSYIQAEKRGNRLWLRMQRVQHAQRVRRVWWA